MCADPWLPYFHVCDIAMSEHYLRMQADLESGETMTRFIANTEPYRETIDYRRGTLEQVLDNGDISGHFDIVYLDGSHYYEDVKADILLARQLVANNGILCGDDLERQSLDCDVAFLMANKQRDFVNGFHPGVTLAVGTQFGHVWEKMGVWAMRKIGDDQWSAKL
jgi:hypothetical protein